MPSFCKFIEMPVWFQSKNFCLQVQQTAAFDKLQVTILLLTRLCLGKKNQLDNKSVRGFGCFITSFILSVLLFCQETKKMKNYITITLCFDSHKPKWWVSDGCHELHPLPLLSLGRSLCSLFLLLATSGRANKKWIFLDDLLHCFLFCISRKEKKLSNTK